MNDDNGQLLFLFPAHFTETKSEFASVQRPFVILGKFAQVNWTEFLNFSLLAVYFQITIQWIIYSSLNFSIFHRELELLLTEYQNNIKFGLT